MVTTACHREAGFATAKRSALLVSTKITPAGVPDAPTNITLTRLTGAQAGSIELQWGASFSNGSDIVGYCMTMTGHDHPGELFIWNAYSDLGKALSDGLAYNPYKAPKQLKKMRKILYTAVWKPLTPFPVNPGFERVTRVNVKPENTQKFLMASEILQAEMNAAGDEFEMGVLLGLGAGAKEEMDPGSRVVRKLISIDIG